MEQQLNSSTGGWIGDDRRDEADFTSVSQTIAKPNVSPSPLSVVRDAIRKAVPRLMELKPYSEIIVPKDFSQEHFSYTIINITESNSYLNNKKTWEGDVLHKEMTKIVTVKNNAISYELERFAVKDCIWHGQEPMLNDVLEWFKIVNYKYAHFESYYFSIYNGDDNNEPNEWNLSSPYLKDQSKELIEFLAEEVVCG